MNDSRGHRTARGRWHWWFLAAILLVALFLRVFQLERTPPGLYPDEAMNGNNALEALRTGEFKVFYPENNGREGLMIALQALSLKAFGVREPWVLRLPSALIGVLTVLGMYFLGAELFSPKIGLFAAFLIATSGWHLYFSRMGLRAILAPLLMVWALALCLASLRKASSRERWFGPALAGGVVFGLGFYSYISFRVMPLLVLAFLPWYGRSRAFWRVVSVVVLATGVVALPIGVYYIGHLDQLFARSSEISVFADEQPVTAFASNVGKVVGMLFVNGDENWRHNYSGRSQLFWPVAMLLLAGIGIGAYALERHRPRARSYALMFAWFGLAVLPVALSTDSIPHALRSILMLPPVLMLAAAGGVGLSDLIGARFARPMLVPAIGAVVCAALAVEAYYTYFIRYANRPEVQAAFTAHYVDIARTIERLPPDVLKIVVDDAPGVAVRGYRMPTQTVMFITDTFDPEMAKRKNIVYVDPDDAGNLEPGVTFHLK